MTKGEITAVKVFTVDGTDSDFENEADAAAASIMVLLGVYDLESCEEHLANLKTHAASIQQRLQIILQPKNLRKPL